MKKAVIISNLSQASDINNLIDAFIVPIDGFSINYDKTFSIEDTISLKKFNKEIFVVVNKNIHNNEINLLSDLLLEIEKIGVDGILFYDVSIVNLKKKLNLKTPLVWSQEHLVTNYETINYWFDKGCEYAFLSSEITKEEMDDIRLNSKSKLFVLVFGYIPMFTSRRHLVNNYKKYFNLDSSDEKMSIYKEGKKYPILDKENGTVVYSNYILNACDEDFNDFDYTVYNSYLINEEDFKKVLNGENVFPSEKGFLYQETIFRVKKND